MMDRYLLRYFLAVADNGNFSRAAQACNVSQPTLSVGIAKLEAMVGKALYHRTNRRVEITAAGGRLLAHARRIEEVFSQAERDIADTDVVKTIRIGVLTTTPRIWMEKFLAAHRSSGSGERIEIVEGRERELNDRLVRGRIDLAVTIIRDQASKGEHDTLFTEGYSLVMAAGHALAARAIITADDLVNEPMILRRQCELLSETSRYFTARRVRPFFPARTMSDDRAIGYVRAGLGVTVMPDSFEAAGIARSPLQDFTFMRDIGVLYAPHVGVEALRSSSPVRLLMQTIKGHRSA